MMYNNVTWEVCFHREFGVELREFPQELQEELLARFTLLEIFGP
jgi:hypothetical protein